MYMQLLMKTSKAVTTLQAQRNTTATDGIQSVLSYLMLCFLGP